MVTSAWTSPSMVTLYRMLPANGVFDWAVAAVRVLGQAGLQTPIVSDVEVPPVVGQPSAQARQSTSDELDPRMSIWIWWPLSVPETWTEATARLIGAPGTMATL